MWYGDMIKGVCRAIFFFPSLFLVTQLFLCNKDVMFGLQFKHEFYFNNFRFRNCNVHFLHDIVSLADFLKLPQPLFFGWRSTILPEIMFRDESRFWLNGYVKGKFVMYVGQSRQNG